MVTSNECYGMSLSEASKKYETTSNEESESTITNSNDNKGCGALPGIANEVNAQDLSFLYSRESDSFGKGTPFSDSSLSKVFRLEKSAGMNKRRKNSAFAKQLDNNATTTSKTIPKEEVNKILSQYNHSPKNENPLYSTTANEFGLKRPTQATYTNVRYGMSQKFSQSFNRTMFRDEGLTSSLTRSNIHDSLTPLFS